VIAPPSSNPIEAPAAAIEAVDADRLRPLPWLREHRHDHAEDHRRGHRATGALDEPRHDQHDLALGEAARGRGGDEDRQPDDEDPPLSDQVAEPSGEQQQAAERDQVGVDDPGEVRLREAEIVLNRGQGDVHDRLVEDDHQHPHAEDDERDPTGAAARVRALGTVNGCELG
jgi:hypothetical protein